MTERVVQAARFFDYYWEKANDEELYELNDIKTNDFMKAVEKLEAVCNLAVQACRITRRRFNKIDKKNRSCTKKGIKLWSTRSIRY